METLRAQGQRVQRGCLGRRAQRPTGAPRRCRVNVRAVLSPQRPLGDDPASHEQEALARARRAIEAVFLGEIRRCVDMERSFVSGCAGALLDAPAPRNSKVAVRAALGAPAVPAPCSTSVGAGALVAGSCTELPPSAQLPATHALRWDRGHPARALMLTRPCCCGLRPVLPPPTRPRPPLPQTRPVPVRARPVPPPRDHGGRGGLRLALCLWLRHALPEPAAPRRAPARA